MAGLASRIFNRASLRRFSKSCVSEREPEGRNIDASWWSKSNAGYQRLLPLRPAFRLALGIYERHGDGAANQHNDSAHEEAGVEPVERCCGALNNTAHDIGCEE